MIDVLIQTFNEELNLPTTLESVKGWVRHVYVVDSGSTDRTREIAEAFGATVVHHAWEGYARQKNWALANLPFTAPWTLIIDADEAVSAELRDELLALTRRPDEAIGESGFYVNRVFKFFGQEVRHCGYFPSWNLRMFRRGRARYEERLVHEHMIVDGKCGYLNGLLVHEDRRGLEHFFAKHNRYATLEAIEIFENPEPWPAGGLREMITNRTIRRRFGKSRILPHLPIPWIWRFFYMFVIRAGILDGRAGWYLCWSISGYEMQVQFKYRELCRLRGDVPEVRAGALAAHGGLVLPEGVTHRGSLSADGADGRVSTAVNAHTSSEGARARSEKVGTHADPLRPVPTVVWNKRRGRSPNPQGNPSIAEDVVPEFTSPWTFKQNVIRALWMITTRLLFAPSFHNWYGWRRFLLRLFGAKVGVNVRVRPSTKVEIPWNLELGDGAVVGDHAILYSLGKITIGRRSVVSQYAHLCAGTHDHRYHDFPLVRPPITIGDDAWVAADAFVGPGVTIGARTVVGARSNVFADLPADVIAVGSPARAVRPREMAGMGLPGGGGTLTAISASPDADHSMPEMASLPAEAASVNGILPDSSGPADKGTRPDADRSGPAAI